MNTTFESVCGGKEPYEIKGDARNAANASRAKFGGRWTVYCCPFCTKWHTGHVVREVGSRGRQRKGRNRLAAA